MSASSLEERVARVEQSLADLQRQVSSGRSASVLSLTGSMSDFPEFDDLTAHGRYVRKTGQLPPPGWKAGDPIPEPEE